MRFGRSRSGPKTQAEPATQDCRFETEFWRSPRHAWRFVAEGLTRWSLVPVLALVAVAIGVAVGWWDLVDLDQPFDYLLAGIWLLMAALMAWRFRPRADVLLAVVALGGGFVIEWWGTSTELWTYFTRERPPLWIIPAWPVAALSTDRLAWVLDRAWPAGYERACKIAYWIVLPLFIVAMVRFMAPSWPMLASQVVLGLMLGVLVSTKTTRRDLTLFVMGTALGWFLEYWGTTRECWTYYTGETPPLTTALAHGFASVAFGRATQVLRDVAGLLVRLRSAASVRQA